ncbi:MAG: alpha/beta hydrolase [Ktedonobacterales bacterium]
MALWAVLAVVGAAILLLAALALLSVSYLLAHRMLRPLRTPLKRTPADYGLSFEEARIPGPRGYLAAWYIPARNGSTLICCHGIHDNRGQWMEQVARLQARSGYGALLFDFAGHGQSDSSLVTYGVRETEDVAAVIEYLRCRGDVDMDHLGIMGYSLGAITAVLAIAQQPELHCLVIESGFADVERDLTKLFSRFTGLPGFPLANLVVYWGEQITRVRLSEIRPIQVIHRIAPRAVFIIADQLDQVADEPYDGESLYAGAEDPKRYWLVEDTGHVQAFFEHPDEWVERVGTFLDEYLDTTHQPDATTGSESRHASL